MHYFSSLGGPGTDSTKTMTGYGKLVFLHPVGSAAHVVHSSASRARNVNALFFMLWWDLYRFRKKREGTRYARLVFCIRWDLRVTYYISVHPGRETSKHFFHARVGPVQIPQKAHWDTLRQTCVFASIRICRSRSAFRCVQATKHRHTIFKVRWDRYGFHKKRVRTRDAKIVFLHQLGSTGHVVHPMCPRHETSTHYFSCSGGTGTDSTNSALGHVTLNLCCLNPVGYAGHIVHSVASGA
jgi:hypothetical protein